MTNTSSQTTSADAALTEELRIDLVAEELQVSKQIVETGRVQINKRVLTEESSITLQHLDHAVEVERVTIGKVFETAPPATRELADGTIVYSVVREVPVVVTRFELVEEVHVRLSNTAHDEHYVVPVRREQIDINRISNPQAEPVA